MLQINITTQPIRLSYNIQNAQTNKQTTLPNLQMETTPPKLEMHQPRGELTIDMTPCRYSIGLKNNTDFARDNAELGRQTVQKGIARIVEEGDQLAAIENKSNALADIAAQSTRSEMYGVTLAPIAAPEIHYQANPVEFNPSDGKINYTLQRGTVNVDYQPGSVSYEITQYPSVNISVVDVKV